MSTTITAEYFTDPLSGWCWAAEPVVRHLQFAFEDVEWTVRPPVLLPTGGAADAEQARRSHSAARESSMPAAGGDWVEDPPASRPACEAVVAVRERTPAATERFLRRVRERVFVQGAPPASRAALTDLAGEVRGVDADALARDLDDGAVEDTLAAGIGRAREVAALDVRTRGSVPTLPVGARPGEDEREEAGPADPDGPPGEEGDREASDEEPGGDAPSVVAPPAILFTAGDDRILARPGGKYDRLKEVVTTLDPDARSALADPAPHGDKELKRRGMLDDFAEQFVDRDYGELIERYVDRFERAFLPEVIEATDATRNTCRMALQELAAEGSVRRASAGEWTVWLSVDE